MSEKEVQTLSKKLDRIMFYLNNDDETGQKGLISEVRDLKQEFHDFKTKYEQSQAIKKAVTGVYGFIGAGVLVIGKWIVEKILEHFHFI